MANKLIIDADPEFLRHMQQESAQLYGKKDQTVFALYGPQKDVPPGVLHFQTVGEAAEYVRMHQINAVLSGVRAPAAPEGGQLYGFRLAAELEKDTVHIHLHSSDRKQYETSALQKFSGISSKDEPAENTLSILENMSRRAGADSTMQWVANLTALKPGINVSNIERMVPKILVVDGGLSPQRDATLVNLAAETDAAKIADFANDIVNRTAGVVIGFTQGRTYRALMLAEEIRQQTPNCPVVLLQKDAKSAKLSNEEKRDIERAGFPVTSKQAIAPHITAMLQPFTGMPLSRAFI